MEFWDPEGFEFDGEADEPFAEIDVEAPEDYEFDADDTDPMEELPELDVDISEPIAESPVDIIADEQEVDEEDQEEVYTEE